MNIDNIPPAVAIPPPPRTTQETQVRTVVTQDVEGRTKIKQLHYITTLYDYKGTLKEVNRTWTKSFIV